MSLQNPLQALLAQAQVVGLEVDRHGALNQIFNSELLTLWLGHNTGAALQPQCSDILQQLFGPRTVQAIIDGLSQIAPGTRLELGTHAGGHNRAGSPERHYAVVLQSIGDSQLIQLQDVSKSHSLLQELQEVRASYESALAVLRAPPEELRLFLGSAMAVVHAIRATWRMPARTQAALREKLGRLHEEAADLGTEASAIGLSQVLEQCQLLADSLTTLLSRDQVSGDELLPLAPRIDAIATSIGCASRIEELRHEPAPAPEEPHRKARRSSPWHEVSERRWKEYLRRRGEELGILARLVMNGAQRVAPQHRRHVDEILQHLLKNALEHGIETPEERLSASKSAAGHISIGFTHGANGTLKMTVHDDGRGFDLSRIGKAAVNSGLLSEESLVRRDPGDLVGLIFKPNFTTEGLADDESQGRGMSYVRRKITHLDGHIAVATKTGRYTLFTIELPATIASEAGSDQPQAISSG